MKYVFCFLLCIVAVSCYRMPEEGEVSTIPDTNNPSMTGTDKPSMMPASPNVDF